MIEEKRRQQTQHYDTYDLDHGEIESVEKCGQDRLVTYQPPIVVKTTEWRIELAGR